MSESETSGPDAQRPDTTPPVDRPAMPPALEEQSSSAPSGARPWWAL